MGALPRKGQNAPFLAPCSKAPEFQKLDFLEKQVWSGMGTYPALAKGRGKPEGNNRLDKGLVHVFSFAFAFFFF